MGVNLPRLYGYSTRWVVKIWTRYHLDTTTDISELALASILADLDNESADTAAATASCGRR